ncbi:MAG: hypothetical protein RBS99_06400, partial [Rhodospirillales bacterium]|nr:hypothetical protein [Rhodospirillales bacterium]
IIDLSMETVRKFADNTCQSHNVLSPSSSGKFSRQTGSHWLQFRGDRRECRSLKHLLAESLLAFEDAKPGTLTSLSRVKGRTKRIVAREPSQLFKSPELAEKYSEPLGNGWYFGTNNSALETRTWLKRAAACAGLKPGADFTTSLD